MVCVTQKDKEVKLFGLQSDICCVVRTDDEAQAQKEEGEEDEGKSGRSAARHPAADICCESV